MHNGRSTQSPRIAPLTSCCGTRLQVVALTRDETVGSVVELVRCSACNASTWRLDGVDVDKERALGALSEAFAPSTPAPKPERVRPAPARRAAPAAPEPELADLLAGWSVLGATS